MRLLLHACCGPCLLLPLDELSESAQEIVIVFANPNIHPAEEYERRRDTLRAYAHERGISVEESPYDPSLWIDAVAGTLDDPKARCRACYRLRLSEAARLAVERGFDSFATTLTVSPYQDAEAIRSEGERAAREAGVAYLHRDFRDRYGDAVRRSRELGMYRQNYCGCLLSDLEARRERAARRDARSAAKQAAARGSTAGEEGA